MVTATRAEYGLLYPVLQKLLAHDRYQLQLVVTGAHLSQDFGSTVSEIEADGVPIAERIEILESGDNAAAISATMGHAASLFGGVFERLKPDLLLVLGDRYEILPIVLSAHVARIPVAHLCGGDVTEGAIDDAIRHCITKLAHLHFVTNKDSGRRVQQLGENPANIHVVGETGLDNIKTMEFMTREQLAADLGYEWRKHNLLVTFHPVTLGESPSVAQLDCLLDALQDLGPDFGVILTFPNADAEGRAMLARIQAFAANHNNFSVHASLGRMRYLSVMHHVDAVVGNSSSGIIEAPAMHTPTVNIGNRQKGRPLAASVVQVEVDSDAIMAAIKKAVSLEPILQDNPYGDGNAAQRILAALDDVEDFSALTTKQFFDL